MSLCGYETATLKRIAIGDVPDDPGAAFWAATEVLSCRGYIKNGQVTPKGDRELRLGMLVSLAQHKEG